MPIIYMSEEVEAEIKRNIPWAKIEPEVRPLVQSLNLMSGIATEGSCEGHVKPNGTNAFMVESALIAVRVSKPRFMEVLEEAVESGIFDISLRFFKTGWFWILLSWEPGDYRPIYMLTRRLDGKGTEED